jgi:hypothetical protein
VRVQEASVDAGRELLKVPSANVIRSSGGGRMSCVSRRQRRRISGGTADVRALHEDHLAVLEQMRRRVIDTVTARRIRRKGEHA